MDLWIFFVTVFLGLIQTSQSACLRCYKGSMNNYVATSLTNPLAIAGCLDHNLPTVFYTFGFGGKVNGPATTAVLTAYIATNKRNVILVDWEQEASRSSVFGIAFSYAFNAVPNAKKVGGDLGNALVKLSQANMNMSQVHLIGHSLGAHLMGYAGKQARVNGYTVDRITGLDPARALFEGTFATRTGLDRTCARFVDIIHTDPGNYGVSQPVGTADFWPNYSGKNGGYQPGCPIGHFDMFSTEDLCSHDRSWKYLVETLSSPTAFIAASAPDFHTWLIGGRQQSNQASYMGELANSRAQGNYYLSTNPTAPYGRSGDGMFPNMDQPKRGRHKSLIDKFLSFLS